MNTILNQLNLDFVIIIFMAIVCLIGYIKGFVTRLYDVLATILSLWITYIFAHPLSKFLDVYQIKGPLSFIGDMVNITLASLALFIACRIIFGLVGGLVKPLLESVLSFLSLTKLIDRILGMVLSLVEGILLVYVILTLVYLPLFNNSYKYVGQSPLASFIVEEVPVYTQNNLSTFNLENKDETTVKLVTNLLYKNYEHHLMDDEKIKQFMIDYYSELEDVDISTKQIERLKEMCQYYNIDTNILKGVK